MNPDDSDLREQLKPIVERFIEEAQESERLRIAAWLLARAIKLTDQGEIQPVLAINMLAQLIKINAIELYDGGSC